MEIQCPQCKSTYKVDDSKVPESGGRVKCRKCGTRFFVGREEQTAQDGTGPGTIKENGKPEDNRETGGAESGGGAADTGNNAELVRRMGEYIKQGDQEAAAKFLLEQITRACDRRQFDMADGLLERLYEAAPMALNEIVKAGEVIEKGKSESIDDRHLSLWSDLYEPLGTEEVNAVYYSMSGRSLQEGEKVLEQGRIDSNLYFVESGRLQMSYRDPKESSDKTIKELTAGDVANVNAFFAPSVSTATLVAKTGSELSCLPREVLGQWKEKFPGLAKKIKDFCDSKGGANAMIPKAGGEARAHKRSRTSLRAAVQLLDASGNPADTPSKVSLADISAGGVSYTLKLPKEEDADQMLGQGLIFQTVYRMGDEKKKITRRGEIVAVLPQPFGDTSVHVRFHETLEPDVIEEIEKAGASG